MPLPSHSRPDDSNPPPLHVLLVEDNLINQRITAQQLRKTAKFTVHVADDGAACLDFLARTTFDPSHSSAGTGTPLSIILLDLEMPIMDGWACARRIRQQQREGAIVGEVPIIALTANARPEQIQSAMEAGADAVVTKPFRTGGAGAEDAGIGCRGRETAREGLKLLQPWFRAVKALRPAWDTAKMSTA